MKGKSLILVFLVVAFVLSSSVPLSRPVDPAAQPQLLALAAAQPDAVVNVIVQKAGTDGRAEAALAASGGQLTKNLSIINAFGARLPALAAVNLAAQPGVRWVSLDAPAVKSGLLPGKKKPGPNTTNPGNAYRETIRAAALQTDRPELTGQGVTVAVVDSGITPMPELEGRILADIVINGDNPGDGYGHGTHVAGIIAAAGDQPGVAPGVNLVNVKVSDDQGEGAISDVVAGLQWVLENKDAYNIRVVNISINSSVIENYKDSPLDAACEILWFNGIVVVVSSGNNGKSSGLLYPPANDPFVITVGSVDDQGTAWLGDDVISPFTAAGRVVGGYYKPDLMAPGSDIYSLLSSPENTIAREHPGQVVDDHTLRLSGTSMASAVASGAAALLLQSEPELTPDQVKYRLTHNGSRAFNGGRTRYLDIHAAIDNETFDSANTGFKISHLLTESGQLGRVWDSVAWNSVAWNSVAWNSVAWNSVAWNSVAWNSVAWDDEE